MTNKKLTIISVSLLSLFLVDTFATFRQQAQDKSSVQKDEPTLVKKGQVTEKEKAYSREFEKEYDRSDEPKLTEIDEPGGLGIVIGEPTYPSSPYDVPITSKRFLGKLACQADAVVVGVVKDKTSHLTENEKFIFTSYILEVKTTIKDNAKSPIELGASLEVTRPGGFIKIGEQLVKLDDRSFKPLETGKEYLLYLRFVSSAKGYKVFDFQSDFALENGVAKSLSSQLKQPELKNGAKSKDILELAKTAALTDCSEYKEEVNK